MLAITTSIRHCSRRSRQGDKARKENEENKGIEKKK